MELNRAKFDVNEYPTVHEFTVVQCEYCGAYYEPCGKVHRCRKQPKEQHNQKQTNFEKLKSIENEKEMAKIICRLYDRWLAFALNEESIENGLIKWLKQEVDK